MNQWRRAAVALEDQRKRELEALTDQGIAIRQAGRLDENLIRKELTPLLELKDAPETAARLRSILPGHLRLPGTAA